MAASSNQILIQGLIELHMSGAGGKEAAAQIEKLVAQSKLAEKGVANVGTASVETAKQVGFLNSAFSTLGATLAGVFAAGAIANWLKESYLGFAQVERQALVVENQIKSLGQATEGANFRQFIAQLAQTSGILDDDLVPAFQHGLIAFRDFAATQEALTIAARFAAAGIGDVGSNMQALTTFFQSGMARALKPFISDVKGAADGTISWAEVLPQLQQSLEDLGKPLDDAQSRVRGLAENIDEFSDSAGKRLDELIVKALRFGDVMAEATKILSLSKEQLAQAREAEAIAADQAAQKFVDDFFAKPNDFEALNRVNTERQAARDKDASDKAAAEKVKAEAEALAKIKDLNESNAEALIREVMSEYAVGTEERYQLELALNEKLRAAALDNARKIGADTAAINALFDERNKAAFQDQLNATGPAPGSGGDDPETARTKQARKEANERLEIAADEIFQKKQLRDKELKWDEERAHQSEAIILDSASKATGLILEMFGKHKAAAIGQLAIDTASAVMQVWADPSGGPWYVKLAKTVAIGAIAHQQLQQIQNASPYGGTVGGGGGAPPQVANAPTGPAQQPANNPSFISPMSPSEAQAMAGASGSGSTIVVNIDKAFGNDKAMTTLARDIQRRLRFAQWEVR